MQYRKCLEEPSRRRPEGPRACYHVVSLSHPSRDSKEAQPGLLPILSSLPCSFLSLASTSPHSCFNLPPPAFLSPCLLSQLGTPLGSAAGFRTQRSPRNGRLQAEPASSEAVCKALREVLVSEKHSPASLPVASARPAARTCGVIHGCPREARGGNELHVLLVMAGCLQPGLCGPMFLPHKIKLFSQGTCYIYLPSSRQPCFIWCSRGLLGGYARVWL